MAKFVQAIVACLIGLVIALVMAEVLLRLFQPQQLSPTEFADDPDLGHRPKPGMSGTRTAPGIYEFEYSNNSRGYRGPREFGPKPAGVVRVLCVGDSFTWGIGVGDDETWPALLEKNLLSRGRRVEVVNAGSPATATDYALRLFELDGPLLEPEIVVLGFYHNDVQGNNQGAVYAVDASGLLRSGKAAASQGSKMRKLTRFIPFYDSLGQHSHLFNLLKHQLVFQLYSARKKSGSVQEVQAEPAKNEGGQELEATKWLLSAFADRVMAAGAKPVCLYIPTGAELESFRASGTISREEFVVKEACERRGMPFLSATEILARTAAPVGELYFAEGHWRPAANLFVAPRLADLVEGLARP
ncbi:MAG: SGNH/GDSL hydrolase family protein [Sphaerospermopsis kisseleviana]